MLDLKELERKLDEALDKETPQSLSEFFKRDILGYEGYYQVDSFGNVYSLPRVVMRKGVPFSVKGRKLKNYKAANGYYVVNLIKGSKPTTRYVHDLVSAAFIGVKPIRYTVNHIDGNKLNNHVSNLQYCTYAENNKHAYDTGLNSTRVWDYVKRLRVIAIKDGVEVGVFNSAKEAESYLGCHHVACIISGKRKTSNGYSFKLAG